MSALTLDERSTPPNPPANGKATIYVDQGNGPSVRKSNGDIETFKAIFGTQASSAKETADLVNTSTAFQNYLTFNPTNLPQGNYLVLVRIVWGYSSGSNDIRVQFQLDNANFVSELREEPKDGGADQRKHSMAFSLVQLNGNHTFDINWAASSGGNQARMFEAEIILFRVD